MRHKYVLKAVAMVKYFIDANLPYYFSLWANEEYIHIRDINDEWTDTQKIWQYAKEI